MFGVEFYGDGNSKLDSEHYPILVIGKQVLDNWSRFPQPGSGIPWTGGYMISLSPAHSYDILFLSPASKAGVWGGSHADSETNTNTIHIVTNSPSPVTLYYCKFKADVVEKTGFGIAIYDDSGKLIFTDDENLVSITGTADALQTRGVTQDEVFSFLQAVDLQNESFAGGFGLLDLNSGGYRFATPYTFNQSVPSNEIFLTGGFLMGKLSTG